MPAIDSETDELILRIAYDGASRAGKTTNLRQLSERLDSEISAPEQSGERTVYFDWMRYRGGSFEGRPIRCELLSAPGQELLTQRRDLLLSTADCIVIVLDSSRIDLQALQARIDELRQSSSLPAPPAIIVQANKCDLPPSLPIEELRAFCQEGQSPVMLQCATANKGEGVRETFVMAVRLAVVRAHTLRRQGVEFPKSSTIDATTMLHWLRTQESLQSSKGQARPTPPTPPGAPRPASSSAGPAKGENRPPCLPRPTVPDGMVWPPVTGRAALKDIARHKLSARRLDESGAYFASVPDCWEIHSAPDAHFESPVAGMECFLDWAHKHSELAEILSGPRCIVLAPTNSLQPHEPGGWRLWQIVRTHRPVRDRIAALLDEPDPRVIARSLIAAGACLLELENARERFPLLPENRLDWVGERLNGSHFVGLLPGPREMEKQREQRSGPPRELLTRELSRVILQDWRDNRSRIIRELRSLAKEAKNPREKLAGEALSELFAPPPRFRSPIRLWPRSLRSPRG